MEKTYRVAIVGTGSIAEQHMAALRQAGERVTVVGAMNNTPERLAEFCNKHNINTAFTDLDALLKTTKPDLVHLCTPPTGHLAQIRACLEAGAWVLCEKPLCASLAEFDEISAIEERTGRYVCTVFQWRYGAAAQHARRLIHQGQLGMPLIGTCQTLWYRDNSYYDGTWHGKWASELGGTVLIHGIHLMDLYLWLMNTPWAEIRAMMGTLDRTIEVEDSAMALVQFESGALGSLVSSTLCPRQESVLRLDCQRGTLEVRALYYAENMHWSLTPPAESPRPLHDAHPIPADYIGDHAAVLNALLDSMDAEERPLVSGAEARRPIEFVTSLYKAALTGQPVKRGSIGRQDPFYFVMHGGLK